MTTRKTAPAKTTRASVPAKAPEAKLPVPAAASKAIAAPATAAKPEKAATPAKAAKPVKPVKTAAVAKKPAAPAKPLPEPKAKLVRDSFTMPKAEYAAIEQLKRRASVLERPAKKSELLRAGIKALSVLSDTALLAALQAVPTIKTGRPKH
jgi:hypothetical protein